MTTVHIHAHEITYVGGPFRKSQIRKFADLNNLLDLRTFRKCGNLRICDFCQFCDLQICNLRICDLRTQAFIEE